MKEIRPNFDDLTNPSSWQQNERQNQLDLLNRKNLTLNPFPIEVYPLQIQEIIKATNQSLLYPIDFISSSILSAMSIAIGNTYRIEVKLGWTESALLFMALVGSPGINKSHPISFALNPIQNADAKSFKEYEKAKKEFDDYLKLTKEEKKATGKNPSDIPFWKQTIVSDTTQEALIDVHKGNLRGIGMYHDELASWFKNFNRYNNGSEEEFYLSTWSGKPWKVNRKTAGNYFILLPYMPIIGTIQPGVLIGFATNRVENGFLDRILFVMPSNLIKESWSESELDPKIFEQWDKIITKLFNMTYRFDQDGNLQPDVLKLSSNAKSRLFQWQRELTRRSNESSDDDDKGIYSKMEIYVTRFALILELAKYGCEGIEGSSRESISLDSVEGAIQLAEYFIKNAFKARDLISIDDPFSKLPQNKKALYDALPQAFTTDEGVTISVNKPFLQERAAKKFFQDKNLFKRIKHGHYEKLQ